MQQLNDTEDGEPYRIVPYTLQAITGVFTISLNLLILCVVRAADMKGSLNTVLKNLAVADTLVGVFTLIRFTVSVIVKPGTDIKHICNCSLALALMAQNASSSFVLCLCIAMYLTVKAQCHGRSNIFITRPNVVKVTMVICWTVWLAAGSGTLIFNDGKPITRNRCSVQNGHLNRIYTGIVTLTIVLQLFIMSVFQVLSLSLIQKQIRQLKDIAKTISRNQSMITKQSENNTFTIYQLSVCDKQPVSTCYLNKTKRMTWTICCIHMAMAMCWAPMCFLIILYQTCSLSCYVSDHTLVVGYTILNLNSMVNVFIYAARSKQFRRNLKYMCCKFQVHPELS